MIALAAVIPFYLFIPYVVAGGPVHAPALELDRLVPMSPAWGPVYLSLFLAALLPAFVLHQQELIRRTLLAYIAAWLTAYAFFLGWPTVLRRPDLAGGDGFLDWLVRSIHASDKPYNCFPSLHVAQCFLAAFAVHRVHAGVGVAAFAWACAVGLSTLFTKQHYVVDVIGGFVLALGAYLAFIRGFPREAVPEPDRRLAPLLALGAVGVYASFVAAFWVAYRLGVTV
jgi:membrane-associated phospholipid phosphatase